MKDDIQLSVVVPLYNEEGSLPELHAQLGSILDNLKAPDVTEGGAARTSSGSYAGGAELIFVDDGSTDGSNDVIKSLRSKDKRVRLITFRRNQGKSAALAVGFKAARGMYVVTMDADLQDNPEEIPALIAKLESGYDLVSGWKKIRHDPISKTIPSRLFNFVTSVLSGISLHDFNCGLKIYRREVVKEVRLFGERHRFIPVLAHMAGFRVGEIPVKHRPRLHGTTKFGAYRFIAGFFDLMTLLFRMKFLMKPLHLFGSLGMLSLLGGMGILIYLGVGWLQGIWIGNRPLFLVGVMAVVAGLQFITLGLIGEMIAEGRTIGDAPIREDSDLDPPPAQ